MMAKAKLKINQNQVTLIEKLMNKFGFTGK